MPNLLVKTRIDPIVPVEVDPHARATLGRCRTVDIARCAPRRRIGDRRGCPVRDEVNRLEIIGQDQIRLDGDLASDRVLREFTASTATSPQTESNKP